MRMPKYKLKRKQVIRGKKLFDILYQNPQILRNYPLQWRLILRDLPEHAVPLLIGVGVAKKHIKSAVTRNLVKRRMRELLRLEQWNITKLIPHNKQLLVFLQFIGSETQGQEFKVQQQLIKKLLTFLKYKLTINPPPKH